MQQVLTGLFPVSHFAGWQNLPFPRGRSSSTEVDKTLVSYYRASSEKVRSNVSGRRGTPGKRMETKDCTTQQGDLSLGFLS